VLRLLVGRKRNALWELALSRQTSRALADHGELHSSGVCP
jgi:hypothetical protein